MLFLFFAIPLLITSSEQFSRHGFRGSDFSRLSPLGGDVHLFTLLRRAASLPGFHSPSGERAARTVKLTRRADDDCIDARGRATQAQLPNALLALALALGFGSLLLLWRARCALTGSRHSRRACGGIVRRMAHTMWASSTPVQGWTVGEPRSRLANLEHRDCA